MSARHVHEPAPNGTRRTIETDSDYRDAERAVDWLSDHGFPVDQVVIVGTDLRYVEQIGGRVTTGSAALDGARQGATIGLLFGLFFGLFFSGPAFFGVLLYGLIAGTLFGTVWGATAHYMQQGQHDFSSVATTRADRYEVQADASVAGRAEQLLATMPGHRSQAEAA